MIRTYRARKRSISPSSLVPLGVSDHKDSGHWDDQAEKLFSKSKATPTYFMRRAELLKHVTATKVLKPGS